MDSYDLGRVSSRVAALAAALLAGFTIAAEPIDGRAIERTSAGVQRLAVPLKRSGIGPRLRQTLHPSLQGASGDQQVIVRLRTPPVGDMQAALPGERLGRKSAIETEQSAFLGRNQQAVPGMRVIARTQLVLNALFVEVDAGALAALADDPSVTRIAPVGEYEKHLTETVPFIGASAVQAQGHTGDGIRVAVLDSGIDYTHADLGGGGTLQDYEDAYGIDPADPANTRRDGLFPTERVVEGVDFVGEAWPTGALLPDDDPIDFDGHGTHVADIIGGASGVAPGVDLYAVKVCSSISTACSGVAMIQGMEYAVDPDGDGDPSDRVDIVNLSLGSPYGQPFDDDISAAVDNASALGVLSVVSAGNSGNKPYIVGSPAAALTALAVAQTQVPSASLQLISVDGTGVPAVFQPWSEPVTDTIQGQMQYGDGAGGNLDGCLPFASESVAGTIVLVDRGACNFTVKIFNIANAGGLVGIIGLVDGSEPFAGAYGDPGGPISAPGFMISLADANLIRSAIANGGGAGVIDPTNQLPLVMQIVSTSSRGPRNSDSLIKPEIGAPGASVSAEVGTGDGATPFGGTSGAAPMVAGSAALLIDAYLDQDDREGRGSGGPGNRHAGHERGWGDAEPSPAMVKAWLATNAETDIDTDPLSGLAPVTRIGGGEVRVDRALSSRLLAWDAETGQSALSFGFADVVRERVTRLKRLTVRNLSNQWKLFEVSSAPRDPADEGSAVDVTVWPQWVALPPRGERQVFVRLRIDGEALPGNFMNSGGNGADAAALDANEFDGYVVLRDGRDRLNVPWHVLPRQAANVNPKRGRFNPANDPIIIPLRNYGVGTGQNDAYSLLAVSGNLPQGDRGGQMPTPDIRAVGINTFFVPPDFCSSQFLWVFAINSWERQSHLFPVIYDVVLDIDRDGTGDYSVFNADLDLASFADGRQVTWVQDLTTGEAQAFFFAEHATNTANTLLALCGEQIGLGAGDILSTNVDATVEAVDFYFGGAGDFVDGLTITPLGERFVGLVDDLAGNTAGEVEILDFGSTPGNTEELGILLFTNGDRGPGARGGATVASEALILGAKGADLSALRGGKEQP